MKCLLDFLLSSKKRHFKWCAMKYKKQKLFFDNRAQVVFSKSKSFVYKNDKTNIFNLLKTCVCGYNHFFFNISLYYLKVLLGFINALSSKSLLEAIFRCAI